MLSASVSGSARAIIRDVRVTVPRIQKRVAISAANKATRKVYTQTIRDIAAATGIKQQILRGSAKKNIPSRVRHNKATKRNRGARVWIGLQKVPLSKVKKGIVGKAPKANLFGNTHYLTGSMHGRNASQVFTARMPSGHIGYYVRKGSRRKPIQEVAFDIAALGARTVQLNGRLIGGREFAKEFERLSRLRLARR